ncbi:SusC/RagA family TonB-linked outer membrane protein [Mucilaginibacter sp. AW1-3]
MKLTVFLLTITLLQVSAAGFSQKISLKEKNVTIDKVLTQIQDQSGYEFFYNASALKQAGTVDINIKDATVQAVLDELFKNKPYTYSVDQNTITIKEKTASFVDKLKEKVRAVADALAAIDVTGRVTDENNQPLSGATVQVKNGTNATTTDVNGFFTLKNVQPNETIVITFIGFDKKELPAVANVGQIKLTTATSKLDEIQIIAYGQTTGRLTTGNISSVSAKEIQEQPTGNPLLALEGKVPGLFITQSSGISGGGVNVLIQGQNSITHGNDPFYVIDGVPYVSQLLPNLGSNILGTSAAVPGNFFNNQAGNPLSFINPDDIESISVLKDADATAIYGSRAANGAILITTKKGRPGPTRVDINFQQGLGQTDRKLDLMNTQQYLEMRLEAFKNDNIAPSATDYDVNGLWDKSRYTDWQKVLTGGTAHYADYNATISGGTANTQYLVGGTFHRETTVYPDDFADQKASIHFSINSTSTNQKFHIGLTGSYLADNNRLPNADLSGSVFKAPDAPPLYNPDGSLNWAPDATGTSSWLNPLSYLATKYLNQTNNLIGNANLSYILFQGLQFSANLGYNRLTSNETSTLPQASYPPENAPYNLRTAQYGYNTIESWIIEPQLNYKKSFGRGRVDALLGATTNQNSSNGLQFFGSGYNSDAVLQNILAATAVQATSTTVSTYKYNAIFGRVNYNWDDKYITDLILRRDGSSRFGAANEFHDFWSVGGAWLFSNETFIKNKWALLSFGKFKASYGATGSDQIGDYQFLNLYTPYNPGVAYQGISALTPNGIPNPYLQWEETRKLNFGLDLGFLQDRITIGVNYFRNRSSNQLLTYSLPLIASPTGNVTANFPASVQNTGWELTANSTNVKTKSFSWSTTFNLTAAKNKLLDFPNLASSSYANKLIIGQPVNIIKAYQFLGVDPGVGRYVFLDSKGNATSTPNAVTDKTVLVDPNPLLYGGFGNRVRYRGFELNVFFQFVKRRAASFYFGDGFAGSVNINEPVNVLTRWQKPGDLASIQRFTTGIGLITQSFDAQQSDANYVDASYIRLKNASLSWQLPKSTQQHLGLQNAQIYLQGQNLLTFTNYPGLDPETLSRTSLPPLRIISLGIRMGL